MRNPAGTQSEPQLWTGIVFHSSFSALGYEAELQFHAFKERRDDLTRSLTASSITTWSDLRGAVIAQLHPFEQHHPKDKTIK